MICINMHIYIYIYTHIYIYVCVCVNLSFPLSLSLSACESNIQRVHFAYAQLILAASEVAIRLRFFFVVKDSFLAIAVSQG